MALVLATSVLSAEPFVANTDEAKVPAYHLPDILPANSTTPEETNRLWKDRRQVLLQLFTDQVYGRAPTSSFDVESSELESGTALQGKAIRQQYRVTIRTAHGKLPIDLLIYRPANAAKPVPCFFGLNFTGNHTVANDREIPVTQSWMRNDKEKGINDNRASETHRGTAASRWPIELIVANGCAVATAYYGDIDPDFDDGFQNGVHGLFPDHRPSASEPTRWGSIAGWAWGMSRLLDAIEQSVPQVDARRVLVIGHSRLGKTALWAGATDERFAAVISNDSGCGGAALSRRAFGETVGKINDSFPHWFCANFHQYKLRENDLPVDQHQLIALAAPRPVYVASASDDLWADPKGEFLSAKIAGDFYERLSLEGLALTSFPKPGVSSIGRVSYHLREGKHDIQAWDWERYLKLAKMLPFP